MGKTTPGIAVRLQLLRRGRSTGERRHRGDSRHGRAGRVEAKYAAATASTTATMMTIQGN